MPGMNNSRGVQGPLSGPPMTLGNMRELSLQTEFEKGNDYQSKY
jgi:hypothetical protein